MDKGSLYKIVFSIKEKIDLSQSVEKEILNLQEQTKISLHELKMLFEYEEVDYIVDRIQIYELDDKGKTKDELLKIVNNILEGSDSGAQMDEWIRILEENVKYPECVIDIFEEEESVNAEDILKKILEYKPNIIHL